MYRYLIPIFKLLIINVTDEILFEFGIEHFKVIDDVIVKTVTKKDDNTQIEH